MNENICYCAFCKSPRKIEAKKHFNWINVGLCGLVAFLMMWILWSEMNPKAIVFFVINLSICEVFIQIRWRLSMVCPFCQFDPLVYMRSPAKAAERVRKHFDTIRSSPEYLLSLHPLQRLLIERSKKSRKQNKTSVTLPRTL